MQDAWAWYPTLGEGVHSTPGHPMPLTSPPQGMQPGLRDLVAKHLQTVTICRDCMIGEIASHDPTNPRPLNGYGEMTPPK